MPSDSPLTFTVEQAAKLLGISRGLAYELVRRGDIPSVQLGRRLLVPRSLLLALVSADEGQAGEGGAAVVGSSKAATAVASARSVSSMLPV